MTQAQLEHASTSPDRFKNVLDHERISGVKVLPITTRTFQHYLPNSIHDLERPSFHRFGYMNLVPGGRFLATRSIENVLQLWDLGFNGSMTVLSNSHPIASVYLGDSRMHFEPDAQMTGDGTGLLFAMSQVGTRRQVILLLFCTSLPSLDSFFQQKCSCIRNISPLPQSQIPRIRIYH
jgi:hypothetical protein